MFVTWRAPLLLALGVAVIPLRPVMSTVWLWTGLTLLVVLLDAWLAPRPETLTLSRSGQWRTRPDAPVTTLLSVANPTKRRLRGLVRDAWQPSAGARGNRHSLRLAPGASTVLETVLVPVRRGELHTDQVTIRLLGPLRVAGRQSSRRCPGRLRVLPAFPSRKHLPSRLQRLRELDGRAAVQVRGQGTEFDSLRDYVRGDDVRSIDWRATARSPRVVVRTWRPERDRRVVIVLDTGRTSAGRIGEVPRLDSAMDAALLIAALAGQAGERVDVVAGDRSVLLTLKGGHSRDFFGSLQDELADIQPRLVETQWRRLVGAINSLGRQRGLVILITPIEASAVLHSLLPVLPGLVKHHRVLLGSVRDPALAELARDRNDAEQTYAAAAAEKAIQQRRDTARLLTTLGVEVIDDDAEALPVALADRYLVLKAHGLL